MKVRNFLAAVFGCSLLCLATHNLARGQTDTYHRGSSELTQSLSLKLAEHERSNIDPLTELKEDGTLTEPKTTDIGINLAKLPEPADLKLQRDLEQMIKPPFGVLDLKIKVFASQRLGGVFSIQGSGDCKHWILFRFSSTASHEISMPRILMPGVCTKGSMTGPLITSGTDSGLGIVDHQLVAILVQTSFTPPYRRETQLILQGWEGSYWDAPAVLNF